MDLGENPPIAYRNFEEVIAVGEKITKSGNPTVSESESESEEEDK